MKNLSKIKMVIGILISAGIFFLILGRVSYVLREKENTDIQDNFAALERDSVDLIFIGTSHQFCSINPDLLYEEYGINSFMLATSAQTVPMSYYAAMEAIELQHPKTIVMEVLYCTNDFRTLTPEMSHTFFDGMPQCRAKKLAIEDLIPEEERIYYYLNLGVYHSRWKDLTEVDFKSNRTKPRGGFYSDETISSGTIPVISPEEKEPMPEEMLKYMELLVELCQNNNVELIWYVVPFGPLYDDDAMREDLYRRQRIFNWLQDYADEKGVEYHNLFYELDGLNLNYAEDFLDTQHFNFRGQEKITRYMVQKGYLGSLNIFEKPF